MILALAACASAADECRMASGPAESGEVDGPSAARTPGALIPVLTGCGPVTEIQFVPGSDTRVAVLAKDGRLWAVDLAAGTARKALAVSVETKVEMGLLGIAFHPKFAENHRFWLSYNPKGDSLSSRIEEWVWDGDFPTGTPRAVRERLALPQPWANHDGGQIQFGPDGMLYAAFGDGGSAGDPRGAGQDLHTLLGKILRLDPAGGALENPLEGRALPEIWAYGLRNPWKFTWAPDGRMVAGDVGQNTWEEVTFVQPGGNHGWNVREGAACFQPPEGCKAEGLVEPIWTYGHDVGISVTGGVVGSHAELGALAGRYLFGDYGTGRIWALALPATGSSAEPTWVGRFPGGISTFGRDAAGRVYVGNLQRGEVSRLVAPR
jgi:glucose/arabinose dehydrogenase